MNKNQAQLLQDLAKKIKSENRDRSEVVASLQKARILTKGENMTTHYSHLKRVMKGQAVPA